METENMTIRVAVLGFGAVGRHIVKILQKKLLRGAKSNRVLKIVAICDSGGGVYNHNCFEKDELNRMIQLKTQNKSVHGFSRYPS